jgi:hypothetical protein
MPLSTRILISLISLCVMLVIVHLVRRKRVDEKYALLWLVAGSVMIVCPLAVPLIDRIAHAVGISYPPALIFLLGFLLLCLINVQFSAAISKLTGTNRILAQRYALLENRIRELETKAGAEKVPALEV